MIHLFAEDRRAVRIDPHGQKKGEKLRLGTRVCVMCRELEGFAAVWDRCGTQTCPGHVTPARGGL
jgi:hypothetical protein